MQSKSQMKNTRLRRKRRIRKNMEGTTERPRMSVFRSNKNIYVQLIDDRSGHTLASASSLEQDISSIEGDKSAVAKRLGEVIAERAIAQGIERVIFDRNGYLYHGRVASVADGARSGGLNF